MQTFLEFIKVRNSIFTEATPPPAAGAAPPGGGMPPEAAPPPGGGAPPPAMGGGGAPPPAMGGGGGMPPAMGGGGAPTGPVQKPVAAKILAKDVWELIEKKYGDKKSKK